MGGTSNNPHRHCCPVERILAGPIKRFVLISAGATIVAVSAWLCAAHFLLTESVVQDFKYWATPEAMIRTWRIKFILIALLLGIGLPMFLGVWRSLILRGQWREQKQMSAWSVLRAYVVIWGLLGASVLALEVRPEPWPFLAYPMYSGVKTEYRFETFAIRGIPDLTSDVRLDFFQQHFTGQSSPAVLDRVLRKGVPGAKTPEDLTLLAKGIYQRYEQSRTRKINKGPAFKAIEIYRLSWDLKRDDVHYDRPSSQELIVRYVPQ
jgi:hypothetical protein